MPVRVDGVKVGKKEKVGLPGIEPGTSRLSGVRSNRLSYKPTRWVLKRRDVRENTAALSWSKSTINYTPQKRICQINLLESIFDRAPSCC